jgi:hypothetical protein
LLSIVYPVRAFACGEKCGWTGTLPSSTGVARRRRQLQVTVALLALALGIGMLAWKYQGRLVWTPDRPPPDGVEEIGEP